MIRNNATGLPRCPFSSFSRVSLPPAIPRATTWGRHRTARLLHLPRRRGGSPSGKFGLEFGRRQLLPSCFCFAISARGSFSLCESSSLACGLRLLSVQRGFSNGLWNQLCGCEGAANNATGTAHAPGLPRTDRDWRSPQFQSSIGGVGAVREGEAGVTRRTWGSGPTRLLLGAGKPLLLDRSGLPGRSVNGLCRAETRLQRTPGGRSH